MRVAVPATVLPPTAGAQAQVGVLRDEQGHQQRQQHRAGSEEEGGPGDDGVLGETERCNWHFCENTFAHERLLFFWRYLIAVNYKP